MTSPPVPSRDERRALDSLSPREIVAELDRWVVGQAAAKRAVAIALRSRIRRRRLPPAVAAEVTPKNILMIGPTGVGKTEIARRLAQLAGSLIRQCPGVLREVWSTPGGEYLFAVRSDVPCAPQIVRP